MLEFQEKGKFPLPEMKSQTENQSLPCLLRPTGGNSLEFKNSLTCKKSWGAWPGKRAEGSGRWERDQEELRELGKGAAWQPRKWPRLNKC